MTRRDSFRQRRSLGHSRSTPGSLWEGTRHREQHPASGMLGRRHESGPALGRRQTGGPGRTTPEPPARRVWARRNVQLQCGVITHRTVCDNSRPHMGNSHSRKHELGSSAISEPFDLTSAGLIIPVDHGCTPGVTDPESNQHQFMSQLKCPGSPHVRESDGDR